MLTRRTAAIAGLSSVLALGACGRTTRPERVDVIIIGAGLSGLNTALLLQELGLKVLVLEASAIAGGRVRTVETADGLIDVSASQIGRGYARVLDACRRFGLRLIAEDRDLRPFGMHFKDRWLDTDNWAADPFNQCEGEERAVPPMMMGRWAAARHNPLNGLDDWLEPRHAALDISLRALMTEHGYSAQAIELAAATVPGISIDDTSVLRMWQEETRGKLERSFTDGTRSGVDNPFGEANARDAVTGLAAISNIEGGCQQLPLAMAAQLGDAVRFHKRVSRIEMTNAGATISCMDGARFAASFVVSSIPFTMLRQVAIEATPNPVARAAIDEMPYANTARLYVTLEEPFWEADGLSPSFSTDGPLGMFWSIDNHGAGPHRAMIVLVGEAGEKIVSMDDAEAFLTNEMARLRPASKGKIKIAAYKDWKRDTLQLGCGFSLAPGQVNAFARDMIRPWQVMHFAGEHTRRTDFGMESAFESSERVVAEILQRV